MHLHHASHPLLLEQLPTGVLCADAWGVIRVLNKACRQILGGWAFGPGQDLRRFPPLMLGSLAPRIRSLLDQQLEFDDELKTRGADGLHVSKVRGRVLRDAGGHVQEFLLMMDPPPNGRMDDQERAALQLQLRRSQRMESIGLLAAGIVHDLNNVLACIMGAAELLEHKVAPGDSSMPLVRQISDATERGALMTRKVLSLARLEESAKEPVNFNQVIRDVMILMRRSVDPRIEIRMQLASGEAMVNSDSTTLHQLMMNLCVNARDAMPEGGELLVSSACCSVEEARRDLAASGAGNLSVGRGILLDGPPDRRLVRVDVRDTGLGIEPALLHRIFDPFFTTKEGHQGTGLGLAMVQKAIEEHGGWLCVTTRKDWGTCFRLFFPWCEEPVSPIAKPTSSQREVVTGRGRIMVVDDDEVVRSTMCDLIRTLGYEVEAMPDGLAAVEAFMQDPMAWDLVLLDLMMPRMDGVEALRRIRALRPDQAVLVVTGFAGPQNLQKLEQIARVPLLMKPIQIRELSCRIADLVN